MFKVYRYVGSNRCDSFSEVLAIVSSAEEAERIADQYEEEYHTEDGDWWRYHKAQIMCID